MDADEIAPLAAALDRRMEETDTTYHRPLYSELDWDDRLVCIKGAKGTGKTTMMLCAHRPSVNYRQVCA